MWSSRCRTSSRGSRCRTRRSSTICSFARAPPPCSRSPPTPKHLGAAIGFLSVLHTWGQNLLHHPHVHCVIPVGGLSPDRTQWVHPRYPFFLPVKVLSRVFRGKFVAGLRRAFRRGRLVIPGSPPADLTDAPAFRAFLRRLFRHDWVVYAKPPFGGPAHVLHYLARYTHRVAISNHRILNVADGNVTFRWKDYRARQPVADHDDQCRRISPSILLARPAQGFRPHSLLWVSRASTPRHDLPLCRRVLRARAVSGARDADRRRRRRHRRPGRVRAVAGR